MVVPKGLPPARRKGHVREGGPDCTGKVCVRALVPSPFTKGQPSTSGGCKG